MELERLVAVRKKNSVLVLILQLVIKAAYHLCIQCDPAQRPHHVQNSWMAQRRHINQMSIHWKNKFTMEQHVILAPLLLRLLPYLLYCVYSLPFICITTMDNVWNNWCIGTKSIKNHRWNKRRRQHHLYKWYPQMIYQFHRHAPNDHHKQSTKSVHSNLVALAMTINTR